MPLGPAASSDSGCLLIIPVCCDVAAGQPWLSGFREGNGGGETQCRVISPASHHCSVWGRGNTEQQAEAQGRGEERAYGTSLVWRPWLVFKTACIVKMLQAVTA